MSIRRTAGNPSAARREALRLRVLRAASIALGGCLALVAAPAAGQLPYAEVEQVEIVQSLEAWELRIPFAGAWTHSSLENPPRIVIDLHAARSRLPRAPGLYSVPLTAGPVEVLRTSQFRNRPGDRKVRVTLVLADALPYMAEQFSGRVWVRIPRPAAAAWGADWEATIRHGDRLRAALPDPAPALPVVEPEAEATSGSAAASPAEADSFAAAELAIDQLLADTTLFRPGRQRVERAWSDAAARLLEDAQGAFLAGDTAAAFASLATCLRFYADSDPGRQAHRLQRFLAQVAGEEPSGPAEIEAASGPWPLLQGAVLAALFGGAYDRGNLELAAEILACWRSAARSGDRWAEAALYLAEAQLADGAVDPALASLEAAVAECPDWRQRPRVALLRARAWDARGRVAAADSLLRLVAEDPEPAVRYRALAARADLHYRRGAYGQARQLYQSLLADDVPAVEREWAHYQVGNCWAAEGAWTEAESWLAQVAGDDANFWRDNARLRLAALSEVHDAALWR